MIPAQTLETLVADMRRLGVSRLAWGEGSGEIELAAKAVEESHTAAIDKFLAEAPRVLDPKLCAVCQTRPKGRIDPALCRECALQAAGVVL